MVKPHMQRDLPFVVVALVAILVGPLQGTAMTDDRVPDDLPAVSLWTPGLVITHETKPFDDFQIYSVYLSAGRRLHTVQAYIGQNVEDSGIHTFDPVDWESTVVPRGAQLFSVTAGVLPETVSQFWVGWIKDRTAYLEGLTEQHAIKAPLAPDESVVFPAVMDGSGAASLFSWRSGAHGASLWQTIFKGRIASPHSVVEIPGRPLIFRAAAVPGHSHRGVVAWVEHTETLTVLGMALVEHGQAKVWRSEPIAGMAPVREQRIGVWASEDGRLETGVVLAWEGGGGPGYRLARFSAGRGGAKSALKFEKVMISAGEVTRAAVEYSSSLSDPEHVAYFLTRDGHLLEGHGLRVVRRSVPSDSSLPIVEGYWVSKIPEGRPHFERLGGP
jgi:hypothetical protein